MEKHESELKACLLDTEPGLDYLKVSSILVAYRDELTVRNGVDWYWIVKKGSSTLLVEAYQKETNWIWSSTVSVTSADEAIHLIQSPYVRSEIRSSLIHAANDDKKEDLT